MGFRPNLTCTVYKNLGTDVYGQDQLGAPRTEQCAVIRMHRKQDRVSNRAIMSGIRGRGWEWVADALFLLTANTVVQPGDKLVVLGTPIRVTSAFPRVDLQGRLDHYEVEGEYWGE